MGSSSKRLAPCAQPLTFGHTNLSCPFQDWKERLEESHNRSITCKNVAPTHMHGCITMRKALDNVNDVRMRNMSSLQLSLKLAKDVLPDEPRKDTLSCSRSKRSLLPFIGKISKPLFGTATMAKSSKWQSTSRSWKRKTWLTEAFEHFTDDFIIIHDNMSSATQPTRQHSRQPSRNISPG